MALSKDCFDLTIRIEDIIWIGGMPETPSDAFKELVWDDPENLHALLGMEDVFAKAVEEATSADDDMDPQEVLNEAINRGKLGFLVKVCIPVPQPQSEASGATYSFYSWGHTYNRWFYTEAFDDGLMAQIRAWRDPLWPEPKLPEVTVTATTGGPAA